MKNKMRVGLDPFAGGEHFPMKRPKGTVERVVAEYKHRPNVVDPALKKEDISWWGPSVIYPERRQPQPKVASADPVALNAFQMATQSIPSKLNAGGAGVGKAAKTGASPYDRAKKKRGG